MNNVMRRRAQQYNDSIDQQPWRCTECNVAVRPGMGDPCRCFTPDKKPVKGT
jgi:hypothetical protein